MRTDSALNRSRCFSLFFHPQKSFAVAFLQGVICLLGIMGCFRVHGQKLNIKSYSVEEGIPQQQILAIYRDSVGYLWVGTYSGLGRYNGHAWKGFSKRDGLSRNHITAIAEDRSGKILVGAREGGLNIFDGKRFHHMGLDQPLRTCTVSALLMDQRGGVWVAAREGLFLIEGEEVHQFRNDRGEPIRHCNTLCEDKDGVIWVGLSGGLARVEGRRAEHILGESLFDKEVNALVPGGSGGLYVGTDKGLFYLEDGGLRPLDQEQPLFQKPILSGIRDWEGGLWFGTSGFGALGLSDGKDVLVINESAGLGNGIIRSLFADREQILWLGTDSQLSKYTPGPFLAYTENQGMVNDFVRALFLDQEGAIWVGTRQGISILHRDLRFQTFDTQAFLSQQVYAIAQARDGHMLFATAAGLVTHLDGTYRVYTRADGLPVDFVRYVFVDRRGRIWVGSEGLSLFTGKSIESLPPDHILASTRILQITEDDAGWLWLGTASGLIGFDPDTGAYRAFEEFGDITVWSLDIDDDGNIWFGTNGSGLVKFDGRQFQRFHSENGLANDYVWQVISAQNGDIWAGHNLGLDRIRPDGGITHYTKRDGLADNEGAATACVEDLDGNLWFGTGAGLTRYNPDLKPKKKHAPVIHLESVVVNDEEALKSGSTPATFRRHQNNFTFRFAALYFTSEEELRYAFKLEGLDKNWSEHTTDISINYFNLGPGDYRFLVKALNGEGLWSPQPAVFSFTILPAFYEALWFHATMLLALAALIVMYVKLKIRRLHHKKLELERLILEKTEALQIANKDLKKAQERLVDAAHRSGMAEIATGILHNVGNILNSINVSVEEIQKVAEKSNASHFLRRFLALLDQHRHDLVSFLTESEQGRKVPSTLEKTLGLLEKNRQKVMHEVSQLRHQIHHINEVVRTQQDYAKVESFYNAVDLNAVIEDAVRIQSNFLKNARVALDLDLQPVPPLKAPKIKLMQVVINLIKNGAEATLSLPGDAEKRVLIRTGVEDGQAVVEITDNGMGIEPKQKDLIFSYGFTTKDEGHGFGLHFCANAMAEMNGHISLVSQGPGKGATFILRMPLDVSAPDSASPLEVYAGMEALAGQGFPQDSDEY